MPLYKYIIQPNVVGNLNKNMYSAALFVTGMKIIDKGHPIFAIVYAYLPVSHVTKSKVIGVCTAKYPYCV